MLDKERHAWAPDRIGDLQRLLEAPPAPNHPPESGGPARVPRAAYNPRGSRVSRAARMTRERPAQEGRRVGGTHFVLLDADEVAPPPTPSLLLPLPVSLLYTP